MGFPQADCEVQLNGAATEQPNGKKSDDFNGEAYCRDATPKRDQAKPAAQVTTPTIASCCGTAVTWMPAFC